MPQVVVITVSFADDTVEKKELHPYNAELGVIEALETMLKSGGEVVEFRVTTVWRRQEPVMGPGATFMEMG